MRKSEVGVIIEILEDLLLLIKKINFKNDTATINFRLWSIYRINFFYTPFIPIKKQIQYELTKILISYYCICRMISIVYICFIITILL